MQEVGGTKFNKVTLLESYGKQHHPIQSVASSRNLTHRRSQSGRIRWRPVSQQHAKYYNTEAIENLCKFRNGMKTSTSKILERWNM